MSTTPAPPDTRPRRAAHETGDELELTVGGTTTTFRQVGWHGQSGAFYAFDEDPSKYERGSFAPLWIIAHCEARPVDDERARCPFCCRADDGRRIEVDNGAYARHLTGAGMECSGSGKSLAALPPLQ